MTLPNIREFRLGGPRGDGFHPYLNGDGAFLGDATPLLEKDTRGRWRPRSQRILESALSRGYGVPVDLGWRMNSLASVARALNKNDRCLAAIALVHAELPGLPNAAAAGRMASAEGRLAKYNEDQPRVPAGNSDGGQWTTGGGGIPAPAVVTAAIGSAAAATAAVGSAAADEVAAILSRGGRAALAALAELGASASTVVGLAVGLILIPINHSAVSEGTLPNRPDISYRYDEGLLSIWRTDDDGTRERVLFGAADSDGLYRDADGNIVGRDLGTSLAVNAPGAVAMVDARASGISINERRGAAAIPIPDSPECEEEWSHAREYCRDLSDRKLLGSGNYRGFGKNS